MNDANAERKSCRDHDASFFGGVVQEKLRIVIERGVVSHEIVMDGSIETERRHIFTLEASDNRADYERHNRHGSDRDVTRCSEYPIYQVRIE